MTQDLADLNVFRTDALEVVEQALNRALETTRSAETRDDRKVISGRTAATPLTELGRRLNILPLKPLK